MSRIRPGGVSRPTNNPRNFIRQVFFVSAYDDGIIRLDGRVLRSSHSPQFLTQDTAHSIKLTLTFVWYYIPSCRIVQYSGKHEIGPDTYGSYSTRSMSKGCTVCIAPSSSPISAAERRSQQRPDSWTDKIRRSCLPNSLLRSRASRRRRQGQPHCVQRSAAPPKARHGNTSLDAAVGNAMAPPPMDASHGSLSAYCPNSSA